MNERTETAMPAHRVHMREVLAWANDVREAHRRDPITLDEIKSLSDKLTAAVEADRAAQSAALAAAKAEVAALRDQIEQAQAGRTAMVERQWSQDRKIEALEARVESLAASFAEQASENKRLRAAIRAYLEEWREPAPNQTKLFALGGALSAALKPEGG